jgi:hypothetical protein
MLFHTLLQGAQYMEVMYQEVGRFIYGGIMVACCDQLHQFIACISYQMKPVYVILTFSFEIN